MCVCLFVHLFSETTEPNELKFWGIIFLWEPMILDWKTSGFCQPFPEKAWKKTKSWLLLLVQFFNSSGNVFYHILLHILSNSYLQICNTTMVEISLSRAHTMCFSNCKYVIFQQYLSFYYHYVCYVSENGKKIIKLVFQFKPRTFSLYCDVDFMTW